MDKRDVTLRHFDVICDVNYAESNITLTLDDVTLFYRITNVINGCKYLHYSQTFCGISVMQWPKAELYRRFQRHVFIYCVKIEIVQFKCMNC